MIDLVVAGSPYTDDDQRALIADPIDLFTRLTGPTAMTVATASLSAAHTTFTAQTARDIVLSAHVSRVPAMNEETLLARARFVGSHGHIDIDLCAPALTVRNPGMTSTHPYGADPITARLRELAAMVKSGTRGHTPASWLEVSRIVDAVIESAATGVAVTIPEEI
jgi:predicted dehydrogenase